LLPQIVLGHPASVYENVGPDVTPDINTVAAIWEIKDNSSTIGCGACFRGNRMSLRRHIKI